MRKTKKKIEEFNKLFAIYKEQVPLRTNYTINEKGDVVQEEGDYKPKYKSCFI